MNPYYANWSYGYTLHPSSEATRGAYQVQYGAPSNWSQMKSPGEVPPKPQVLVTSSASSVTPSPGADSVKIEPPPPSFSAPPSTPQSPGEDPTPLALLKLHELAIANKLVERWQLVTSLEYLIIVFLSRYEKVEENGSGGSSKVGSYKVCVCVSRAQYDVFLQVVLFLGNEIYQGSGITIKAAKQQAALQVRVGCQVVAGT